MNKTVLFVVSAVLAGVAGVLALADPGESSRTVFALVAFAVGLNSLGHVVT